MEAPFDLAVVGGGASGLLLLWHRLRLPDPPQRILWVDAAGRFAQGPAYATIWPQHLLNVPAANMGALPHEPQHFLHWLHSPEGIAASRHADLPTSWTPTDFVPRVLYGAYLRGFLHEIEETADAQGITLRYETALIDRIEPGYALHAADGRQWQAETLALAMGNQPAAPWRMPMQDGAPHPAWLGRMWDWATQAAPLPYTRANAPAVILGSGLTGVDAALQLRAQGWQSEILMLSRHARLPARHILSTPPGTTLPDWPPAGSRLSAYLYAFRRHLATLPDWRLGMDALRPHTRQLWQALSPVDQRRFWSRLGPVWNIHRHRMAPPVAAWLAEEMAHGRLALRNFAVSSVRAAGEELDIVGSGGVIRAALVVDCTGPSYDLHRHPGPLAPLIACGRVQIAQNGLGLRVTEDGLVWPGPGPIVALGALGVGQWFESVAMPELRDQASAAAEILSRIE